MPSQENPHITSPRRKSVTYLLVALLARDGLLGLVCERSNATSLLGATASEGFRSHFLIVFPCFALLELGRGISVGGAS